MKPRAGPIQDITDDAGASGGVGFVLYDDKRLPCATFGYLDRQAAQGAVRNITAALADAKSVSGTPR
jgi:hypothetical protein